MPADGLRRDKLQLRDTDAGGADGLEQQLAALVARTAGGVQQAEILGAGEFPPWIGKNPALALERLGFAGYIVNALLVIIDSSQHRVHGGRGVTFFC